MDSQKEKKNFIAKGKCFQWRIPWFYWSLVRVEATDVGG